MGLVQRKAVNNAKPALIESVKHMAKEDPWMVFFSRAIRLLGVLERVDKKKKVSKRHSTCAKTFA